MLFFGEFCAALGLGLIVIAFLADRIGLGARPGLGTQQLLMLLAGIVLAALGSACIVFSKEKLRFGKTVKYLSIQAVILFVALCLIDYLSTFFVPHRQSPIEKRYHVGIVRSPKPYVMFGGLPYGRIGSGEKLNRLGYRGTLPDPQKRSGEYRIFMLGGSTVFLGDPSLPVLLEEEFRKNGFGNVRVFNFGAISSCSGQALSRIVFEIADFEPDLIVMYNGANDIRGPLKGDPRAGYPFNFIVYEHNPLLESDIRSYPRLALFLYGSNLLRFAIPHYFLRKFIPLGRMRSGVAYGSGEWKEAIAKTYARNLVKADRLSRSFGAGCIVFYQPLIYFKDTLSAEEKERAKPDEDGYCVDMRKRIRPEIGEIREREGVTVIDLSDIYDDTPRWVFEDRCHTRQEAKAVVAERMFEGIIEHIPADSISGR